MFALQAPEKQSSSPEEDASLDSCTPNILPCRIHHDGPVESLRRYWTPMTDEKENTQTAHFRGRRLQGRRVEIPEGYQGIVATPTDRVMPSTHKENSSPPDDVDAEPEEPIKILEKQGTFDHFVVWGHEAVPASDDRFVKGVEEWVKLAEAMHSNPATTGENEKNVST